MLRVANMLLKKSKQNLTATTVTSVASNAVTAAAAAASTATPAILNRFKGNRSTKPKPPFSSSSRSKAIGNIPTVTFAVQTDANKTVLPAAVVAPATIAVERVAIANDAAIAASTPPMIASTAKPATRAGRPSTRRPKTSSTARAPSTNKRIAKQLPEGSSAIKSIRQGNTIVDFRDGNGKSQRRSHSTQTESPAAKKSNDAYVTSPNSLKASSTLSVAPLNNSNSSYDAAVAAEVGKMKESKAFTRTLRKRDAKKVLRQSLEAQRRQREMGGRQAIVEALVAAKSGKNVARVLNGGKNRKKMSAKNESSSRSALASIAAAHAAKQNDPRFKLQKNYYYRKARDFEATLRVERGRMEAKLEGMAAAAKAIADPDEQQK